MLRKQRGAAVDYYDASESKLRKAGSALFPFPSWSLNKSIFILVSHISISLSNKLKSELLTIST